MSSEVHTHEDWGVCLLCSLQCRLGIRDRGGGWLEPVFPPGEGLCARGQAWGELAMRVRRGAAWDGETGRELGFLEASRVAAERIGSSGEVVCVVDGNARAEVLALVSGTPSVRGFVAMPGEDFLLLAQVWASGAQTAGLEVLEGADGLLLVGDPFASHPRSAKPVLDFKQRHPRSPLVVLDSSPHRTALFATHPVILDPGVIPSALSLFLGEAGTQHQISPSQLDPSGALQRALAAGQKCRRWAIVVASSVGAGPAWARVGFEAGVLASRQGAPVAVLTACGNAGAAARFLVSGLLDPVGTLSQLSPEGRALLVVGEWDSVWTREVADFGSKASHVVHLGPQRPTWPKALWLPGPSYAEDRGTVLSARGTWEVVSEAISPPAGAQCTEALLRSLLGGAGLEVPQDVVLPPAPTVQAGSLPPWAWEGTGSWRALLRADPRHVADGAITSRVSFLADGVPTVVLPLSDARALGIAEGQAVLLSSATGTCRGVARVSAFQPAKTLTVSATSPEARSLFATQVSLGFSLTVPTMVDVVPRSGT